MELSCVGDFRYFRGFFMLVFSQLCGDGVDFSTLRGILARMVSFWCLLQRDFRANLPRFGTVWANHLGTAESSWELSFGSFFYLG